MRYFAILLALSSVAYANTEDIFPDQSAIIKRLEYSTNVEMDLKRFYKQTNVSLFGMELEHILILSPHCQSIKNYLLTDARKLGILSATCRWYDGQVRLRIPK